MYKITEKQRSILQRVQFFYLGSNQFHLANAFFNLLSRGHFKDETEFYTVRALISSIVNQSLVNTFFNISKEIKS